MQRSSRSFHRTESTLRLRAPHGAHFGERVEDELVGVALGEIAGIAGQHAVASAILTSLCERDEMVDAGLDLAARLYPGQCNVAVGASSAPTAVEH